MMIYHIDINENSNSNFDWTWMQVQKYASELGILGHDPTTESTEDYALRVACEYARVHYPELHFSDSRGRNLEIDVTETSVPNCQQCNDTGKCLAVFTDTEGDNESAVYKVACPECVGYRSENEPIGEFSNACKPDCRPGNHVCVEEVQS